MGWRTKSFYLQWRRDLLPRIEFSSIIISPDLQRVRVMSLAQRPATVAAAAVAAAPAPPIGCELLVGAQSKESDIRKRRRRVMFSLLPLKTARCRSGQSLRR